MIVRSKVGGITKLGSRVLDSNRDLKNSCFAHCRRKRQEKLQISKYLSLNFALIRKAKFSEGSDQMKTFFLITALFTLKWIGPKIHFWAWLLHFKCFNFVTCHANNKLSLKMCYGTSLNGIDTKVGMRTCKTEIRKSPSRLQKFLQIWELGRRIDVLC